MQEIINNSHIMYNRIYLKKGSGCETDKCIRKNNIIFMYSMFESNKDHNQIMINFQCVIMYVCK